MSGSTTSTTLITGDTVGQTVTFQSKNPTDATTYVGVVSGFVTPQYAPSMGTDLTSYNAAVQRADPTVGDITTLHYFLLTLQNDQNPVITRVFANEWISIGTFAVVTTTAVYSLDVYDDPANGETAIIALLNANGYRAVVSGS